MQQLREELAGRSSPSIVAAEHAPHFGCDATDALVDYLTARLFGGRPATRTEHVPV